MGRSRRVNDEDRSPKVVGEWKSLQERDVNSVGPIRVEEEEVGSCNEMVS